MVGRMSRGEIDSWTVESNGIRYRVDLDPDYDARPDDYDCYSPEAQTAWLRDEWRYVGVTVTPQVSGTDYTDTYPSASAALWGVEYGTLPATAEDAEITQDRAAINKYPVPDLISESLHSLRHLRDRLNALNLEDAK